MIRGKNTRKRPPKNRGPFLTMGRKVLFQLIMFGLLFLFFEGLVPLAYLLLDKKDIFDHRAMVLERLNETGMEAFKARSADPVLGWDHFGPRITQGKNCIGTEVGYTIDVHGARTYEGYDPEAVQVVVVGDSFTNGAEVSDTDAYPAQLAGMIGASVANHGVGGYGPLQSILNLEQKLQYYPAAKVAILGIMYENIYRMVNSYRPVLYDKAFDYGLKPYMAGGALRPYPDANALDDIERFKQYTNDAFDRDFWAKPAYGFPYSWTLAKGLSSKFFIYRKLQKNARKFGVPEYFLAFRSEDFLSELFPLLRHFTEFCSANDLIPLVVFIPHNRYDTRSVTRMIERERERFPEGLLVGDVGEMDVNWARFNLQKPGSGDFCHPSTYGYRKIAEYTADLLRRGACRTWHRNANRQEHPVKTHDLFLGHEENWSTGECGAM